MSSDINKKRKIEDYYTGIKKINPKSLTLTLQKAIEEAITPEEINELISELQNAINTAKEKLASASTITSLAAIDEKHTSNSAIEIPQSQEGSFLSAAGSVTLLSSSQSGDFHTKTNMCERNVDADFVVGPNKHPFSLSIMNENTQGDDAVKVVSELFELELTNRARIEAKLKGPSEEYLTKFFKAAGITQFHSSRYTGDDTLQAMIFFLGDIIASMIEMIEKKTWSRR